MKGDKMRLKQLLESKVITLNSDDTYTAIASDGIEVQFGMRGDEQQIEEYLKDYPTPEDW